MAEEIKQLQALLHEFDGDGTMLLEMEEGGEEEDTSARTQTHSDESKQKEPPSAEKQKNRTVKLKYGSLIKTIEASSRNTSSVSSTNPNRSSNSSPHNESSDNDNQTFCRNCLRLMFTVFYLIYSKGWVIINTTFIFIVIYICYSIK